MKAYVKIALFLVFFVAVSAIFGALYLYNLQRADLSGVKPDFRITAVQLEKDFESNETAASAKYINKVVEVTGNISSLSNNDKNLTVNLRTENDLSSVICTLSDNKKAAELKTGDEVTIRGECSGFLMDVLLNNCILVK